MEEINAKIETTHLGYEDHGIPTCFVNCTGPGWGQSLGGYNLLGSWGIRFVMRIIDVLGVENWEAVAGTVCRVRRNNDRITAIGHIVEDRWFCPEDEKNKGDNDGVGK